MEDPVESNIASPKPLSAVTFTKRQKDENKLDLVDSDKYVVPCFLLSKFIQFG